MEDDVTIAQRCGWSRTASCQNKCEYTCSRDARHAPPNGSRLSCGALKKNDSFS
jgi:hypothetical protein